MKCQSHHLRTLISAFAAIFTLVIAAGSARAVDIGPMTWTPRSDWINVKNCSAITGGPNAVGNGTTDDTAAIQAVFDYLAYNQNTNVHPGLGTTPQYLTVYFPAGTYKISNTLRLNSLQDSGMEGVSLIGCGSKTTIQWASTAPSGPAMFAPNGTDHMRYLGFVWDGNGRAGCGIELNTTTQYSPVATYESQIRIENSSFKNFTATGTYISGQSLYGAGIAQGFYAGQGNPNNSGNPTSESMVYNCRFYNCTVGVGTTLSGAGNYYMWNVDGCEFDNCGTGVLLWSGANGYMITNTHFQGSTTADIYGGFSVRARHCTSSGSYMFYREDGSGSPSPDVMQDCWVDSWTKPGAAIFFANLGPNTVFDCNFTNPPAGAGGALHNDAYPQAGAPFPGGLWASLILSDNYAPAFPSGTGIVDSSSPYYSDVIPPGLRGGLVSSPNQTFLKTSWPADSTHIIDVTVSPYTADKTGASDSTATIQAAINAAQTANNGSVVYFPAGTYHVSSTLTASGGNYTLQGSGVRSSLRWTGAGSSQVLTISNPQNISVQALNFSDPTSDIVETATGASSISFEDVHGLFTNGDNSYRGNLTGQGLVFSNLPAGSTVNLGHTETPLTVVNCGAAQILAKFMQFNTINVSGAGPKTGFLGIPIGEGGQQGAGVYDITINDNQNFVMGDYYVEQVSNDLDLERGAGTGTGHVTFQGVNSDSTGNQTSILANNYAGRLFISGENLGNNAENSPVNITQTGSNPLDMVFAGATFSVSAPAFTLGSGANVIQADGLINNHQTCTSILDSPNPLTSYDLSVMAGGLDDLRQLETADAARQAGLVGYWKLDEATGSTSADSTISGLSGTWTNGPTFSATHPTPVVFADPGCLTFNGVNQYVSITSSAVLPAGRAPRTICGWAKSGSLASGVRWIASYGSPNTDQAMFIGMNGTALWGGGFNDDLSVPNFWDNNWHFIALTYDGTTANLYADGVLKATAAKTSWNLVRSKCRIGQQVYSTPEYWNGSIDDVRIYNRALSAADISSLAGN